jgi:hypothetical protein
MKKTTDFNKELEYLENEYIKGRKYVNYICKKHGKISQRLDVHLKNKNCKKCSKEKEGTYTKEKILEKAKPNYKYQIEDKIYKSSDYIKIVCDEHGEFKQKIHNHFYLNQSCPKCSKRKKFILTDETIDKVKNLQIVEYNGYRRKSIFNCEKHGEVKSNIEDAKKYGCVKCNKEISHNTDKLKFIEKSKEKWKGIIDFDYSTLEYKGSSNKMILFSRETGWIKQLPYNHINGFLPKMSTGEIIIESILLKNNIQFTKQKTFENCKNIKKLRFDFYIPSKNICIEFNGKQHYNPVNHWGGIKKYLYQIKNDEIKNKFCQENNIKLIIISNNDSILEKIKEIC